MSYILIAVLLIAAAVLGLRLRRVDRQLRKLADAVEQRKPFLIEDRSFASLPLRSFETLLHAANRLISDNARRSRSEQSHLDQIRATLGSLREAVLIVDEQNFVVLANEALRQLVGSATVPAGHRVETLLQGADLFSYLQSVRRSGSGERREVEVTVGGVPRWFEVTGVRLAEGEERRGVLVLAVLHDITQMKQLERMRKDFVANVSHELRTPVTIIKGFVDTLMEDHRSLSEAERERFLGRIHKNTERLYELLEELLTLSRLESGSALPRRREAVEVDVWLGDAAENFRARLSAGQGIELDLDADGEVVQADPVQLSQVLNNLMDNVLRHARGFRTMRLGSAVVDGVVRCWVEDDGAGIPEKDLPNVFERFYRVDKGRSRESGGTGLGLSIAKHIIQAHGGAVFAESRLGGPTRVGFVLPRGGCEGSGKVLKFDPAMDA